jgi:acyl carrier protein
MVTMQQLTDIIGNQLNVNPTSIRPESRLIQDLGACSFDLMDIVLTIAERFHISVDEVASFDLSDFRTVDDVYSYLYGFFNNNVANNN